MAFNLIRKPSTFLCWATWNNQRTAKPCGPVVGWGGVSLTPPSGETSSRSGFLSRKTGTILSSSLKGEAWEWHESGRRKKWKYGMTVLHTWNWYHPITQPYCNLKKKRKQRKRSMLFQVLRKLELSSRLVETGSALREVQVSCLLCDSWFPYQVPSKLKESRLQNNASWNLNEVCTRYELRRLSRIRLLRPHGL